MKYLETLACRFLISRFKKDWGADCETYDLDDFPPTSGGLLKSDIISSGRCGGCRAEETISFLEHHIWVIK